MRGGADHLITIPYDDASEASIHSRDISHQDCRAVGSSRGIRWVGYEERLPFSDFKGPNKSTNYVCAGDIIFSEGRRVESQTKLLFLHYRLGEANALKD